mmetsp:Transcript_20370/g.35031  ORF Transcript_20370/g.35031 Transcript_20370/m.35031 type:complete len:109 (-) Transcript_20370:71-397(-)
MKVIQLLVIVVLLAHSAYAEPRVVPGKGALHDKALRNRREECSSIQCVHVQAGFHENCVLRCISYSCYMEIFGEEELEEGEVDPNRTRLFNQCAGKELAEMEKKEKTQ